MQSKYNKSVNWIIRPNNTGNNPGKSNNKNKNKINNNKNNNNKLTTIRNVQMRVMSVPPSICSCLCVTLGD